MNGGLPKDTVHMMTHVLPLRPETPTEFTVDATVTIPRNLTKEEAKRIAYWLEAVAVDDKWVKWRGVP